MLRATAMSTVVASEVQIGTEEKQKQEDLTGYSMLRSGIYVSRWRVDNDYAEFRGSLNVHVINANASSGHNLEFLARCEKAGRYFRL